MGTTLYGVGEAASVRVNQESVTLKRLPAEFDGLRVAVVSDLHLGPARGEAFTRTIVDMVNAERPDLIAIVGDLSDETIEHVGSDLQPLADLRAPLGVFGVSGNHEQISDDVGAWMDEWRSLGITTINNSSVEIRRGAATIDVAGVHDLSNSAPYEPDLDAAVAGRPDDRFTLLLAHQPNHVREAAAHDVDRAFPLDVGHADSSLMLGKRDDVVHGQEALRRGGAFPLDVGHADSSLMLGKRDDVVHGQEALRRGGAFPLDVGHADSSLMLGKRDDVVHGQEALRRGGAFPLDVGHADSSLMLGKRDDVVHGQEALRRGVPA
ncbi:metallophosphoesterase [Gordonia phthalatica]|uniref:metallophosphoesterase n=1 Tax=Gordonia phthalatica TaxID=1136941 RepID=UPI001D041C9C|nr:metallophosphoesterase [Gordonia phthalatica]